MEFKEGCGWKACYDEERNLYTAERGGCGYYHLYDANYTLYSLAPWQRLDVTSVTVSSGVTNIPDHLFVNCVNLVSVSLPDELPEGFFVGLGVGVAVGCLVTVGFFVACGVGVGAA